MQDRNPNRRRDGRRPGAPDDERQPLTNESALGRAGGNSRPRRSPGSAPRQRPFDDERQPLTSENPYSASRGGDRRGGPRDDRRGGPRDDRRGGPRDDRRGGPRDDRRGGPRDDRRSGPRDDRRGRPQGDRRSDRRQYGGGERGFEQRQPFAGDERQPLSNESPALRGRSGGGGRGRGGSPSRGRGGRGPGQGRGRTQGGRGPGAGSGFGTPESRRKEREVRRSKAYVSDAFIYRENLDEAKPTERKMRSRRNKPSGGDVQGE